VVNAHRSTSSTIVPLASDESLTLTQPEVEIRRSAVRSRAARVSRELIWVLPFAGIALIVLAPLRTPPHFGVPVHSRVIIDGQGTSVAIGEPFRGAVFTWGPGIGAGGYLEAAQAPHLLARVGSTESRQDFEKRSIWNRIYPELLRDDHLWDPISLGYARGPYAELERMLTINAGAFFGSDLGPARLLRRIGLPTVFFGPRYSPKKNMDDFGEGAARLMAIVSGYPERAEALIDQNYKAYDELATDLGEVPLTQRLRVLVMGTKSPYYVKTTRTSYQPYLVRAQVNNATQGLAGQRQDAERILSMDPDFIFLMWYGASPKVFMADPLWRGLKAVRNKRVYRMLGPGGGGLQGLTYMPVTVRWMAEIVYPHRLKPEVRGQLRELYFPRFGYRMSDAEIDADLHLDVNAGSDGYARFAAPATSEKTNP
jgi:ABC-type Fe3+-hydroxamate transport system substrate-binding protein